jgi:hypothetical protein
VDTTLNVGPDRDGPLTYQIRLTGHLPPDWEAWFDGMTITLDAQGDTILAGPVLDQAALHGLLRRIRDLGLPLQSVTRLEASANDPSSPLRKDTP